MPISRGLGCGNMGAAFVVGLLARTPNARIVAVDPDPGRTRALLPEGVVVDVQGWLPETLRPALAVLAIKPQALPAALPPLVASAAVQGMVASIIAEARMEALRHHLRQAHIVRTMPTSRHWSVQA